MQPFPQLGRRGQIDRLRRLGQVALAQYGLDGTRLTPLRHENNTTFKLETGGRRYVLRINRIAVHTLATVTSEMAWLAALRRDTELGVPEPMTTREGTTVVLAGDPGVPGPRLCVLLGWQEGRFVDERLTPAHLRKVGLLMSRIQAHGLAWSPPVAFARPRVDTLTDATKHIAVHPSAEAARCLEQPAAEDADRSRRLVAELLSTAGVAVFSAALEMVWRTTRELATQHGTFGLIHADLHQANYLFHGGEACAIDFDDCGWGFYLYDLAVTLSELEGRDGYVALRSAFLSEYSKHRPLPDGYARHLHAFAILRRLQLLIWILENREHAAFRDNWRAWSGSELAGVATAIRARPTAT
jgi:Ser/Thr protein kinase RdoA (MazF antagonist)